MNVTRNSLLRAALAQFESKAMSARANLDLYLNNPSAVAEHPDIVGEVLNLTCQVTEAEENVRTLEEMLINEHPIGIEQ